MITTSTPQAFWKSLTTDQQRHWLMKSVMQWPDDMIERVCMTDDRHDEMAFFPHDDWNHTVQVLKKAWELLGDEVYKFFPEEATLYTDPKAQEKLLLSVFLAMQ